METILTNEYQDIFFRCVEDCSESIMITDRDAKIVYVNPAWIRTYGYGKEEAFGQTPRLIRSHIQEEPFYHQMWKSIVDPLVGFWRGELVNRAKDGRLVTVLLTITPYRSADGEVVGYMGIALDMTAQKQLEMTVMQQDRLASIGMLAGGLAHEIGTPLGVIRGRAEFLMMKIQDEGIRKGLEVIVSQIDRISKLIKSLLRVSRLQEEVKLDSIPLEPVLHEVCALISQNLKQEKIELVLDVPKDVRIYADPNQVQQVFLNLMINSIHAIQQAAKDGVAGPHKLQVLVTRQRYGVAIAIKDTGCGIAPENMKKLFHPFFTTKDIGLGTGLGLAIVSKLMTEMHGKISASSEGVGRGATFTVYFKTPEVQAN